MIDPFFGSLFFTVLEVAVFLLVTISTPIPHFFPRSYHGQRACYTMWGYKNKCPNVHYTAKGNSAWGCPHRKNTMDTAAAFAVVSVVLLLGTVVIGGMMVCNTFKVLLVPIILSCLLSITILISWACVASVHNDSMCGGDNAVFCVNKSFKSCGWNYAVGFYMMVVGWCVQVIDTIFIFAWLFS